MYYIRCVLCNNGLKRTMLACIVRTARAYVFLDIKYKIQQSLIINESHAMGIQDI